MAERSEKVSESEEELDRLSNLNVLSHILSFLDTKWVVQTCMLSKTWKSFWTTVPSLNIQSNSFDQLISFREFVSAVLDKRDPKSAVDTFRFICYGSIDDHLTERVVDFVIAHHVNHLVLMLGGDRVMNPIPQAFLHCRAFKTLQLTNFALPKSYGFSTTLTSLHLASCSFSYDSDCCDLLELFPNLNNLCLIFCNFTNFKILKIPGPQLQSLTIVCSSTDLSDVYKVEISAPKLSNFSCVGMFSLDFSVMNLPSLEHVNVHVWLPSEDMNLDKETETQYLLWLLKFFRGLYKAQFMKLSEYTIQVLNKVAGLEHQPTTFNRLKSLELTYLSDHSFAMPENVETYILKGSPHARTTRSSCQSVACCCGDL